MPVKVLVAQRDATRVAKELFAAAEAAGLDSSHVRVEKTRGFGFILSDDLAKHMDVSEDVETTPEPNKPDSDSVKSESSKETKPKRGRPAGKKNQEPSDGE